MAKEAPHGGKKMGTVQIMLDYSTTQVTVSLSNLELFIIFCGFLFESLAPDFWFCYGESRPDLVKAESRSVTNEDY